MAFNLGAFAGGLAQGGANTYFKMGEMQRQEEELAMRKQEAAYLEEQRNQERELNRITALTLGAGDKRTVADQSTVNQNYEGMDAPAATGYKEVAYTPQQQMADFKQRALAAGVPLQKVTAVSSANRAEKYAEREEMALGFSQQVMDEIKANPTDLTAVFNKHFKGQYNEGKLPGLGDGKTAEVVPMEGTSGGQSIVLKNDKGEVTKTIPLDVNTLQALTGKWTEAMMRDSNPGNWWKSREEDLKARQVGAAEKSAGASVTSAEASMKSAEAAVMNARTNKQAEAAKSEYYRALAKKTGQTMTEQKLELIEANSAIIMKANPNMTKAEADLKAAQEIFRSPEARSNVVTAADVNKFLETNIDDPSMKVKDKNGKMVLRPIEERTAIARRVLGGTGGPAAPANQTDAALANLGQSGADPFAPKGSQPPGAVDTDNVPAPPARAIPSGPTRYGNIDPAMQDRLQANVTAVDAKIAEAEATLRRAPNLENAQNLQRLRLERDKLAANPLLR